MLAQFAKAALPVARGGLVHRSAVMRPVFSARMLSVPRTADLVVHVTFLNKNGEETPSPSSAPSFPNPPAHKKSGQISARERPRGWLAWVQRRLAHGADAQRLHAGRGVHGGGGGASGRWWRVLPPCSKGGNKTERVAWLRHTSMRVRATGLFPRGHSTSQEWHLSGSWGGGEGGGGICR